MTTARPTHGGANLQGMVGLFGLFAGLCAVFARVVTGADMSQEYAQERWPAATATLQRCSVDPYYPFRSDGGGVVWNIECRVSYPANDEQVQSRIRSRSARGDAEVEEMRRWVDQHRSGSAITVRYDPADHRSAVLTTTDMPYAGPRTPNNLRLLLIASVTCAVFLTLSLALRGRTNPGT